MTYPDMKIYNNLEPCYPGEQLPIVVAPQQILYARNIRIYNLIIGRAFALILICGEC